jgi:NhaP-type Na+/H+ or K+/H+ antiporter
MSITTTQETLFRNFKKKNMLNFIIFMVVFCSIGLLGTAIRLYLKRDKVQFREEKKDEGELKPID